MFVQAYTNKFIKLLNHAKQQGIEGHTKTDEDMIKLLDSSIIQLIKHTLTNSVFGILSNGALFDTSMRLLNGLLTIYLAFRLFRLYSRNNRRFFLYWCLGYLFYGVNILFRVVFPANLVDPKGVDLFTTFFAFLFVSLGFAFLLVGLGEAINRVRYTVVVSVILPLFPIAQIVSGYILVNISILSVVLPYAVMAISLFLIEWKFDINLRLLIIGWIVLLFANIGWFTSTMTLGLVDLFSALGKVIFFLGMIQPGFSLFIEDMRTFLIGGIPGIYHDELSGKMQLINLENTTRDREIQWIKEHTLNNSKRGVRTILVVLYDIITVGDIMVEDVKKDLYFVRVLQGHRSSFRMFEEEVTTLDDDLNQLDLLFSDVFNFSLENKVPIEIIFFSLSQLIHTHGWKRIYTFILSKLPAVKSSKILLTMFYYPETHENRSDIVKFETLSDEIIK
jgi:hypothetical protein